MEITAPQEGWQKMKARDITKGFALSPLIIAWSIAFSGCAATGTSMGEKKSGVSTAAFAVAASVNYAEPVMAPCRIRLLDKVKQVILIEVPGYRPFRAGLERTPAGWRWKGINFGHCVTIAVDVSVGGIYFLTKEQYVEAFRLEAIVKEMVPNYLHVVAAHESSREWHKIASLPRDG